MKMQMTLGDLRRVVQNTQGMSSRTPLRIVIDNGAWGRTELFPVQDIKIYQPSENVWYLDFESLVPEED